ncbi:MAG: MFS transporter [Propionibacteriaceae bacterium]
MLNDVRRPNRAGSRPAVLAVLLTGQMMASIDGSIVSVAAPTIRAGLQATDAEIQLVVSGYLLTTGVLFVTCARIGDVIGHRRAFLSGLSWFTLASLLCGVAVNPLMLVLARIAQAMGAALLMPQVFSLIHRQWDGDQRRRAIGLYSMVLALGVALGQVIGGLVVGTDLFGLGWRPVFLINVPIGVLALVLGARQLPGSGADEHARLDPAGVALLTVAMTAITLPLIFGADQGWPTWTWIVLTGGGVLLGLFVRHEIRARHPVLDLAALKPREVRWGMVSCCIVMGCYTVFLLILTLHLQSQLGYTPLQAGLTFVPYAIGFGALSLSWNVYPRWVQRVLPIVGPLAFAAGVLLVVMIFRDQWSPVACTPLLCLAGAGHAASYSPLIAQITSRVGPGLASAVSALNSTGPVLAEVMAVAGLGSVYFAAAASSDGLLRVTVVVGVLLIIAAGCATVASRSHHPGRGGA